MQFTDTHCHIHESTYDVKNAALDRARTANVSRLICVGTDEITSREAVVFAEAHDNVWASLGLHPHNAKSGLDAVDDLRGMLKQNKANKIVAIGECGLDYYYNNSPREQQIKMLHAQIELAQEYDLPLIFHVREAFDDFWPIFDSYKNLRGVLHSFTDDEVNLETAIARGLYIGVNGISTFARDKQEMYSKIPLDSLLLETDSPFLTPKPHRGNVNEPAFITLVAEHLANLQSINLEELSRATERNAHKLFLLNK